MKILNPEYKPHRELALSDAEWDALKAKIRSFLQTNADKSTVAIADVRALDTKLSNDTVWTQIAGEMELIEIPSRG